MAAKPVIKKPIYQIDPIVQAAQDDFDETLAHVQKQEAIAGELLAQANVVLQQAAKLEAESPKKLETPKPKTVYALQEVTKFIQNKFFLNRDESYQLIGELWDAIEQIWHDESKEL